MWYRKGTVQATDNSEVITGTNTEFVSGIRIGDGIIIDGKVYEITNVSSNTLISITPNFSGTSGANKKYAVIPVLGYDKDLSDAFNRIRLEFEGYVGILQDLEQGQFESPDLLLPAASALTAGQFVEIIDGEVVPAADCACGFVRKNFAIGETAEIYHMGVANRHLFGLTPNSLYWLGSNGNPTKIPPTSGTVQIVGRAVSETTMMTLSGSPVEIKP